MTDQQPHTPTATQIREDYAHLRYHFADGWSIGEERVQFDNWLTAEIAAAEQRGAIKALRDAADIKLGNEYYEMLVEDELNARADDREIDLLEGDDE